MTTGEIIVAVLTSSAFTGLLVEIVRTVRRALDRKRNKGLAKLETDITTLKGIAVDNSKSIDGIKDELDRQKETDMVLLHDRIWEIYERLKNQDSIDLADKANLEYLYDEYKQNNGNHQAALMFELIQEKPVRIQTEKKKEELLS